MQQSLLLLLFRTALSLKTNFPRTWLSGEGAGTNVHLGELSQVSQIYHTHIQIETTKQKHSISGGKIGFLKRLVSSTILVLSIRIKYCRFVCTICVYSQKPVLQVKLLD